MTTTIHPSHPTPPAPAPLAPDAPALVRKAPSQWAKPSRLKANWWKLAIGVVVLAGLVLGIRIWFFPANGVASEITATVTRGTLVITVSERAELESSKTLEVRCDVEGRENKIVWIVPEGTHVTKGEKVLTFDTDALNKLKADQEVKVKQAEGKAKGADGDLKVAINKAADEIEKAKLALKLAKLDKEKYLDEQGEYIADLQEKKGALALAKKDLEEARDKLEQFRKSVKKGLFPAEQLRIKDADFAQKQFAVSRDEAKLVVLEKFTRQRQEAELSAKAADAERALDRAESSGKASIDKAESDKAAADITFRLEKTTLERLDKQLAGCAVTSPGDGILVYSKQRWWDDNSRIQAGAMVFFRQPLFSLPDLAQMQMKVKIHEAQVKKVKQGQKAEIRIEAYANQVLHGTVKSVATMANAEGWMDRFVKEYETIVTVDDLPLEAGLKPGFTGDVKIQVNELPDVLMVPVQAVGQVERQHVCFVAVGGGFERRAVTVGENNDKFVEIKEGLSEGEKVALDARARLGAEAKTTEPKPEPKAPSPTPMP
jgi:RND family efflux transporter MFP subunit